MFSRLLTANICSELLKSVNKMIMRTGTKALDNDPHRAWWKEASVYQIYPSSFKDSNGDGLGDIPGIIEKLDYMKGLGVDVVWLSPVYKSPQVDMGYDISDYYDIDARYGTVKDIETLINGLHCRGMKLVMDLVVNHTSDQHGWFLESKASKNSPKRDWYIWRPAKYDTEGARRPPNNWRSIFGGSAWRWDERTQEYYLHLFCPEQPDLNWENPTVRTAVYDAMSFWLNKGVDGFRMDVINLISKASSLPDAPVTLPGETWQPGTQYYANGPRMHEFLHEMRKEVLDKYDAMTVGEMPWIKAPEEVLKAIGRDREELDMVFQFDIVDMDLGASGKFTKHDWDLKELKGIVNTWQTFMQERGGWNALFLENHDQPRSISRFVTDKPELRGYAAKMLATFYALQRGTLYLYQGQELGMSNLPKDWGIREYKDVETLNHWNQALEERRGNKGNMDDVMEMIQFRARDNSRTPIQWDDSANAGFTTGDPWMRVNDDYKSCNAAQQISDKNSVYNYWRSLLELRKGYEKLFIYGHFKMLTLDNQMVFAYQRTLGGSRAVIVSNFSAEATPWSTEDEGLDLKTAERIMGNYDDSQINDGILLLRPLECAVFIF